MPIWKSIQLLLLFYNNSTNVIKYTETMHCDTVQNFSFAWQIYCFYSLIISET